MEEFIQWDVETALEEVVCQYKVPSQQPSFDGEEVQLAESLLVKEFSKALDHARSQPLETLHQIDVPSKVRRGSLQPVLKNRSDKCKV